MHVSRSRATSLLWAIPKAELKGSVSSSAPGVARNTHTPASVYNEGNHSLQ